MESFVSFFLESLRRFFTHFEAILITLKEYDCPVSFVLMLSMGFLHRERALRLFEEKIYFRVII